MTEKRNTYRIHCLQLLKNLYYSNFPSYKMATYKIVFQMDQKTRQAVFIINKNNKTYSFQSQRKPSIKQSNALLHTKLFLSSVYDSPKILLFRVSLPGYHHDSYLSEHHQSQQHPLSKPKTDTLFHKQQDGLYFSSRFCAEI